MKTAHRLSLAGVALAVLVIVTGAYITSTEIVARQSQSSVDPNDRLHQILGIALLLLTIGLAIRSRSAWLAVGMLVFLVALGWPGPPLSPGLGVFHALLAHLLFATAVVASLMTSAHWNRPAELSDVNRPFLRPLALATPPVVFTQITLGALYRHNVTGIMLHVAVAMIVALLALILCSVVLQNYPRPASLRRAAGALIAAVLVQVSLGIASLVMLLLNFVATGYFIASTVAHVTIGAATLAASIVMTMEVWRSVPRFHGQSSN